MKGTEKLKPSQPKTDSRKTGSRIFNASKKSHPHTLANLNGFYESLIAVMFDPGY